MRLLTPVLALLGFSSTALAVMQSPHGKYTQRTVVAPVLTKDAPKKPPTSKFLNAKTKKFAVNGNALPEVDFNIGESYAGLLPISTNQSDINQLFFWFFPSDNPAAEKEITIWLNGGPGCSSLDGLFQEHGPFLWQPGQFQPFANPYSWTNLTNMVYIDQPVTTGFSRGTIEVNDETDVANQFMGFWKNFINTFSMQGFKIYITGESYAGMYVPYIASGMLDQKDKTYFNVQGIQINDPSINFDETMLEIPAVPALLHYQNVIGLNDTFVASMTALADTCGYTDYFNKYTTTFPPPGPLELPSTPNGVNCDVFDSIVTAALYVNPCFNIYHLIDYCPYIWDEMGFPSLAAGPHNYFNRSDVQAQIHVPPTNYFVCAGGPNLFPNGDQSVPSALGPLPSVIERTNNVIIGHGLLDFLLFANGSLLTIQNMTWNGAQGFQTPLSDVDNFFVPYHQSLDVIQQEAYGANPNYVPQLDTAGAGFQGRTHTERGLTFVTVNLAGHEIPQYAPGAAYRQLEFLLGRIKSLEQESDYSTQTGNFGN